MKSQVLGCKIVQCPDVDIEQTENMAIPEIAHAVRVCTTQQTVLLWKQWKPMNLHDKTQSPRHVPCSLKKTGPLKGMPHSSDHHLPIVSAANMASKISEFVTEETFHIFPIVIRCSTGDWLPSMHQSHKSSSWNPPAWPANRTTVR